MNKPAFLAALLAGCGFDAVPPPGVDDPGAPPPSADAVALARASLDASVHLVVVTGDDGAAIDGADLGPLDEPVFDRIAARGIDGLVVDAAAAPVVHVAYADLAAAFDPIASIEAVDNYPRQGTPYLYPVPAAAAPAIGRVAVGELLDYQVELCAVLGADAATADAFTAAPKAFMLCHHAIDRAIQIRQGDLDHPEQAAGYPEAGAAAGYYRTGPYLVVPRDPAAFITSTRVALAVNGVVRQDDRVALAHTVDDLAADTLAIGNDPRWSLDDTDLSLIPGATLPAGLVWLTGTPDGVAYRPPSDAFLEAARRSYFEQGGILTGTSLDHFIADRVIADQRASGRYLAAGDVVEATGTHLGTIRIAIE